MKPEDFKQPIIEKSVCASDFGLNTNAENNTDAFQKALSFCKQEGINRLTVLPGIYSFIITEPFELTGIQNFEIYAPDVRFVFFSPITLSEDVTYFKVSNCDTLKFTGLSIDWDTKKAPLSSLVQVISRTPEYVDFLYLEEGEIPESAVFITTNAVNSETFTPGVEGGREYNTNGNQLETFLKREKIGEKTYRCYQNIGILNDLFFQPGTCHIIRHYVYNGGAFSLSDSINITFENVTIFAVPGFGVHAGGHISHVLFHKFKIILPDFEKRYLTATADGVHFSQSDGYILFQDCDLGYQGDDCINIHDCVFMGLEQISSNQFRFGKVRRLLCNEGDLLEFRNPDLSPTGFSAQIDKISDTGIITLKEDFPFTPAPDTVIYNRAYHTHHYEIRNCYFHETRARGVLAQADDGLIENCTFYRIQGAAIQIESGASPAWSEGTGVNNLVIRNNKMIECDINDWDKGVLYMSTFLPKGVPIQNTKYPNPTTTVGDSGADFRTPYPMFTNILIENNLFQEYPRRAMILTSFDGVTLKNNIFENNISRKYNNPERGSVWAALGNHLTEENNQFKPSPYMCMPEIEKEF